MTQEQQYNRNPLFQTSEMYLYVIRYLKIMLLTDNSMMNIGYHFVSIILLSASISTGACCTRHSITLLGSSSSGDSEVKTPHIQPVTSTSVLIKLLSQVSLFPITVPKCCKTVPHVQKRKKQI